MFIKRTSTIMMYTQAYDYYWRWNQNAFLYSLYWRILYHWRWVKELSPMYCLGLYYYLFIDNVILSLEMAITLSPMLVHHWRQSAGFYIIYIVTSSPMYCSSLEMECMTSYLLYSHLIANAFCTIGDGMHDFVSLIFSLHR